MQIRSKKIAAVAVLGVALFLGASFGQSLAQGFGGLEQFFGGGSSGLLGSGGSAHRRQYSGQPDNAVTVERNVAPFIGKFSGKQKASSYEGDLNANFACYPAVDAGLPNDRTFVCYTGEEQRRVPE
ncbi:MAG: hypothetical protein JO166_08650 [Deltaproteobacteria bacterium]|nr:hypothetical protein [Deltaproteobacteria bacterium]